MAKKKAPVSKPAGTSKAKHPASTAGKGRAGKTDGVEAIGVKPTVQSETPIACDAIGECAGMVWCCLHDHGPQSLAKLKKRVDAPADLVLAAVGWLAREGKLNFESDGKQATVALA